MNVSVDRTEEIEENDGTDDVAVMKRVFGMQPNLRVERLVSDPYPKYKISGPNINIGKDNLGKNVVYKAVTVELIKNSDNYEHSSACNDRKLLNNVLICVRVLFPASGNITSMSYIFTPFSKETDVPVPSALPQASALPSNQSAWQRLKGRFTFKKTNPTKSWGETLKRLRPWGGRRRRTGRKKKTRRHFALK